MSTPTAIDHARTILSAVVPDRRDYLDAALRHLTQAHFLDQTLRNLFIMFERYADVTGAVMSRSALGDMLRGKDAGIVALYQETYDLLSATQVTEADFRWAINQVRDLAAERATADSLMQALEVLHRGVKDSKGHELRGHVDARSYVLTSLADVERELSMQEAPEGDTRLEGDAIMDEYAHRKVDRQRGRAKGVLFGITDLDFLLGGLLPGELDLIAAYSSEGKTTMACQLAWHAAVVQGRNVAFLTTETLRPQVRRKLIARHSRLPHFELEEGLDTRDLKNGTVPEALEGKLQDVVNDFTRNPAYGHLYVAQVPRGANVATIESKLHRIARMWHIDLCVIDYLQLLASSRRRDSDREELGSILRDTKVMAATFDDGQGLTVVSPWQISRAAWEEACKSGYYTLKCLSETAEAERTPDVIVTVLGGLEVESRYAELKAQVLKNRDGVRASSILLDVDYATCMIGSKSKSSALNELLEV